MSVVRCICVSLMLCFPFQLWAETVKLASLYWPPYSGKDLVQEGASVAVARAAFKAMGHELQVDYFPWPRALAKAEESGSEYIGYFPEYFSPIVESRFIFSESLGESPLGIIQLKSNPITWKGIMDLRQFRIGVVRGYVNTTEFDYAVARGMLKVDASVDDVMNLKKLLHKRVDGSVMDPHVMEYLVVTHDAFDHHEAEFELNEHLLELKKLFVCFRKSQNGKKWADILNQGLKKIDQGKIYHSVLNANKSGK